MITTIMFFIVSGLLTLIALPIAYGELTSKKDTDYDFTKWVVIMLAILGFIIYLVPW